MKRICLLISALSILILSCEKEAGTGGTSTITGKVIEKNCNSSFTTVYSEYAKADQDVYIIYGDDGIYSDRTRTNYDGTFKFDYLRKGKYTIYVYSKDWEQSSGSGIVAVKKEIEITDNDAVFTTDTFEIYESDEDTWGTATIVGRVLMQNWDANYTYINSEYYKADENVYLIFGNDSIYTKHFSTDYNGYYRFTNLPLGNYTVYALSEDNTMQSDGKVAKKLNYVIDEAGEVVVGSDLIIYK
jgi:hypothetical protein